MIFGLRVPKPMIHHEESNLELREPDSVVESSHENFATLEEDRGNNFNLDSSINGSRQRARNNGRETAQLLATFDNFDS